MGPGLKVLRGTGGWRMDLASFMLQQHWFTPWESEKFPNHQS